MNTWPRAYCLSQLDVQVVDMTTRTSAPYEVQPNNQHGQSKTVCTDNPPLSRDADKQPYRHHTTSIWSRKILAIQNYQTPTCVCSRLSIRSLRVSGSGSGIYTRLTCMHVPPSVHWWYFYRILPCKRCNGATSTTCTQIWIRVRPWKKHITFRRESCITKCAQKETCKQRRACRSAMCIKLALPILPGTLNELTTTRPMAVEKG